MKMANDLKWFSAAVRIVLFGGAGKKDALNWDQIANMAFLGLSVWLISKNSSTASTLVSTIISKVQTTIDTLINFTG